MMASWYLTGADGRRFCWNKEPTFICPRARSFWDVTDPETGEVKVVERQPGERMGITFTRHVSEEERQAAELLGMDPGLLAGAIRRVHSNNYGRRRVNGKLTDQCKACGARMDRLGFRCWIERPYTKEEAEAGLTRATVEINRNLGFDTPMKTERSFHVDTKAKAERWARREVQLTKEEAANVKS